MGKCYELLLRFSLDHSRKHCRYRQRTDVGPPTLRELASSGGSRGQVVTAETSLSLVNLIIYKHLASLFPFFFSRVECQEFYLEAKTKNNKNVCVSRFAGAARRWKSLLRLTPTILCPLLLLCTKKEETKRFRGFTKHLKITEWLTSESLRGPHGVLVESFSFSLSLLPSPRCRKSCGFRGSGQGEAGGWPPPPDHHLTVAYPSSVHRLALSCLKS